MNKLPRALAVALVLAVAVSACGSDSSTSSSKGNSGSSEVKGEVATRPLARPAALDATFQYEPTLPVPAVELPGSEELIGGSSIEVSLTAADGTPISGTYTKPAGPGPFPVVILQHGLGGRRQDMQPMHQTLTSLGFATMSIDARGHGQQSSPEQLPTALAQGAPAAELMTQTVLDLRQSIDYLVGLPEVDASHIGYVGFSLGGILGADLAAVDDRIAATALVGAGADWSTILNETSIDWIAELRNADPSFVERAATALNPTDPKWWAGDIAPRPLLIIRGTRDNVVSAAATDALIAAAGPDTETVSYEGGHALDEQNATKVSRTLYPFLQEHLAPETSDTGSGSLSRP